MDAPGTDGRVSSQRRSSGLEINARDVRRSQRLDPYSRSSRPFWKGSLRPHASTSRDPEGRHCLFFLRLGHRVLHHGGVAHVLQFLHPLGHLLVSFGTVQSRVQRVDPRLQLLARVPRFRQSIRLAHDVFQKSPWTRWAAYLFVDLLRLQRFHRREQCRHLLVGSRSTRLTSVFARSSSHESPRDVRVKRKVHEPFPSRGGWKGTPQAPGRASWTVRGPLSMRSFCGPRGHGGGEPRDGPETDPIGFGFDWKANPPFPGVVNSAMGSQRVRASARCGRQPRRASPWRGRSAIDGGLRGGEEGWTRTG